MTIHVDDLELFDAPKDEAAFAGEAHYARALAPYDRFMVDEGLPVVREIGIRDLRDLELADWPRLGGRGAYIQLLGTEELWGMYVLEIPPGGALEPEHHLYEEVFYVVSGRGSTEVWIGDDESRKARFEWRAGSLFAVPLNSWHRLVNATREPALVLVATTAPSLMNHFRDSDFIFGNDYEFTERYRDDPEFFQFKDTVYRGPTDGRAMLVTNLVPDIVNSQLPLDNQRSPGYRRVETYLASNTFYVWLGEHPVGKYSKAHFHPPSPVLVCLRGEGYTYTWRRQFGPRPFADGHADQVLRQEYVPGGMVAAAPGGGDWFHQHFGVSADPLRFLYLGGLIRYGAFSAGVRPGETKPSLNLDIAQGGSSIAYHEEDPHFRREFEAALAGNGVESLMTEAMFRAPAASPR